MKKKKPSILRFLPLIILISLVTIFFIQSQFFSTGKAIETASETTKTTAYIYSNGLVASYDSNGEEKFYVNDHLGGTSVVVDENGNKISEEKYYAYGEEKQDSGERFTYTGKEKDDSGLHYYGARFYDSASGRFIQPDPISGEITNPQSLNRYAYVLNNPMKYVDPSGMEVVADATNTRNEIKDNTPTLSNPNGAVNTEDNPVVLPGQTVSAAEQEEATRVGMNNFLDKFSMVSAVAIGGGMGALGGVGATGFQAARAYGPGFFWSAVIEGMGVNGLEKTQLKFIAENTESACNNKKLPSCQTAVLINYAHSKAINFDSKIVDFYWRKFTFTDFLRSFFSRSKSTSSTGSLTAHSMLEVSLSSGETVYLSSGEVIAGDMVSAIRKQTGGLRPTKVEYSSFQESMMDIVIHSSEYKETMDEIRKGLF